MALTDFFKINLPYGMKKYKGGWYVFNREYAPLGWNRPFSESTHQDQPFGDLPVLTSYKGLTDDKIKLTLGNKVIYHLNKEDRIETIFFYDDSTNPLRKASEWERYFFVLKALAKYRV